MLLGLRTRDKWKGPRVVCSNLISHLDIQNASSYYLDTVFTEFTLTLQYTAPSQCTMVMFGDDNVIEENQVFSVILTPGNDNDMFINGNTVNVTVIDDESKYDDIENWDLRIMKRPFSLFGMSYCIFWCSQ